MAAKGNKKPAPKPLMKPMPKKPSIGFVLPLPKLPNTGKKTKPMPMRRPRSK